MGNDEEDDQMNSGDKVPSGEFNLMNDSSDLDASYSFESDI